MQLPECFYYPFLNYFSHQHYLPQITCFSPLPPLNSNFHKQYFPKPELAPILIPQLDRPPNDAAAAATTEIKLQLRSKKVKHQVQKEKSLREKAQPQLQDICVRYSKAKPMEQKQGRNANSNLLRMFFRRLHNKIEDNPQKILCIIKKCQMKITLHQFLEWFRTARVDYRNYIRLPTIKKLFEETKTTKEHTKLVRILLKQFIDCEAINCYWTSKKLRKDIMGHNYRSIRSIFKQILHNEDGAAN